MDYATFLPMLALLLAIGAATGVIAGLLGVGGGIVLVPAFFYLFGQLGFASDHLMQVCIGTSAAAAAESQSSQPNFAMRSIRIGW